MSDTTCSKLLPRATGRFGVLVIRWHTIKIDENGIDNTISFERAMRAPNVTHVTPEQQTQRVPPGNVYHDAKLMAPRQSTLLVSQTTNLHLTTPRGEESAKPTTNHQHDGTDPEYIVDCIVKHMGSRTNIRYVVQWYDYGAEDNTEEPPENLPQHFITRYWRGQQHRNVRRNQ